jgi:hypothetical protein
MWERMYLGFLIKLIKAVFAFLALCSDPCSNKYANNLEAASI